MHPQPKDTSILHLQQDHRSSIVWDVGGSDSQRSRHRNPNNVKFPSLHSRMIPILQDLSFDDDVSVLLGLKIDGPAVTSFTVVDGGWGKYVKHVFEVFPFNEDGTGGAGKVGRALVGGRLKFNWLNIVFPSLPNDASNLQLRRYTQSYILQLIGGVLFTNHSGDQVHCIYIPLISDLESCAKLSWGSAVLAFLYRELCKSYKKDKDENVRCLILLQLWAWSRLHTLALVPRAPCLINPEIWGDLPRPYGLR
ncbi:serine/threonine-protein phosphatase 7 long form homolog [Apium graveolens]|uniref:serine/threonine-protein phosphatase 7 long form homolog n=1 Tax=Apium graveolens TaxID=4045 RepID=UPI003D79933F